MTRARTLADMISDGVIGTTELADDAITPVKLDETGSYAMAGLTVDTNTLHVDSANNRVGFGTTSPARSVTIFEDDQPVFQITNNTSGTANTRGLIQYIANGTTDAVFDNQGSGSGGMFRFMQAGTERLRMATSAFVVNEGGNDYDFRVESDANANMIFVDSSTNKVGVGYNSPDATLSVQGGSLSSTSGSSALGFNTRISDGNQSSLRILNYRYATGSDHTTAEMRLQKRVDSTDFGYIGFQATDHAVIVGTGYGRKLATFAGSTAVFNDDSYDVDFRVESDTNSSALFVDAGTNTVNMGTSVAATAGSFAAPPLYLKGNVTGTFSLLHLEASSDSSVLGIGYDGTNNQFVINASYRQSPGGFRDLVFQKRNGTDDVLTVPIGDGGSLVVNDASLDHDFRIESDGNAHMFMIDAGMNKAAFGTSPQTAIGGLVHTGSLSVGSANHIGYSVYSNHEGNIPSNTTVSVMDFEGPAYARYMKVTVSGYLCRKEVYFAGYQSWDNQSGSTVGSTTIGTQIFAHGSNASAVTIYLEVLSTSGTSGNPKYRLKISTGGLSGQLYDTTSVVEFFNPPHYVTYQ